MEFRASSMAAAMTGSKPAVFTLIAGGAAFLQTCHPKTPTAIKPTKAAHHGQGRWTGAVEVAFGIPF